MYATFVHAEDGQEHRYHLPLYLEHARTPLAHENAGLEQRPPYAPPISLREPKLHSHSRALEAYILRLLARRYLGRVERAARVREIQVSISALQYQALAHAVHKPPRTTKTAAKSTKHPQEKEKSSFLGASAKAGADSRMRDSRKSPSRRTTRKSAIRRSGLGSRTPRPPSRCAAPSRRRRRSCSAWR